MSDNLYRREALNYKKQKVFGDVILIRPLSFSFYTILALLGLGIVFLFLIFGSLVNKVSVIGYVEPKGGIINVYANKTGTIKEIKITVGQSVNKGNELFIIDHRLSSTNVKNIAESRIMDLKHKKSVLVEQYENTKSVSELEKSKIKLSILQFKSNLIDLSKTLKIEKLNHQIKSKILKRYKSMSESRKVVSWIEYQEKNIVYLEQQVKIESIKYSMKSMSSNIDKSKLDLKLEAKKLLKYLSKLEESITEVDLELTNAESSRDYVVLASTDGTVSSILTKIGKEVDKNSIAVILPTNTQLSVNLLVPSSAIGFVKKGQEVLLRYDPYPYQRFGHYKGSISSISKTTFSNQYFPVSMKKDEPIYKVGVTLDKPTVHVYGNDVLLKIGMTLKADILQGRQSFFSMIIDPLRSLSGRV